MGDILGFIKYDRENFKVQEVEKRVSHWDEFIEMLPEDKLKIQASRCMDCGVPFCHNGCPVNNLIPEWNDLVYRDDWYKAFKRLMKTNNFPEFTGRVCPAPCENSCVLAITKPAVAIKNVELTIIEKAYEFGWMKPQPPKTRTGKRVAVIGSGPAGLASADQLNKYGHSVTIFEKNGFPGGLLSIGIPNFKLDKKFVKRRIDLMEQE
ncbi:MAG: glutamate synthase, partial [Methanobacteriota archaeon]